MFQNTNQFMVLRTFSCWVSFCYLSMVAIHQLTHQHSLQPGALMPVTDRSDLALILILMTLVVLAHVMVTMVKRCENDSLTGVTGMEHELPTCQLNSIWLVVSTPLKNMKVSWDYSSQYMEKSSKCSKPPTSNSTCFAGNPYGP